MPTNDPEYQRKYMQKKRQAEKTGVIRSYGNEIVVPGVYEPGHIHEWLRRLGEDTAKCNCGEVVKYKGKMLNRHTDGLPNTSELIRGMPQGEIDKILNHPAINTNKRAQ